MISRPSNDGRPVDIPSHSFHFPFTYQPTFSAWGMSQSAPRLCNPLFSPFLPFFIGILTPQKSKPELRSELPWRASRKSWASARGETTRTVLLRFGQAQRISMLVTSVEHLQQPMKKESQQQKKWSRSANFTATNLLLSYLAMYQFWQKFTSWLTFAIFGSVLVSLEE